MYSRVGNRKPLVDIVMPPCAAKLQAQTSACDVHNTKNCAYEADNATEGKRPGKQASMHGIVSSSFGRLWGDFRTTFLPHGGGCVVKRARRDENKKQ